MVELAEAAAMIRFSRRRRPAVGTEALVGREAAVAATCRPEGLVRIDGEIWAARCDGDGCDVGERVRIVDVTGLTLTVVPAPDD